MKTTTASTIFLHILLEGVGHILFFPIWWYSKGLLKAAKFAGKGISDFNATLGFTIWVKNLFTPMFGQRDIAGRLISFFMRLVNIVGRGLALVLVILVYGAIFLAWCLIPVFLIYQLAY